MLKEILGVADDPPARRRWFHDDYFDLFVWQASGEVTLIQVCYGADATERALVWDKERGFFQDGPPAPQEVFAHFLRQSGRCVFEARKHFLRRGRAVLDKAALLVPHQGALCCLRATADLDERHLAAGLQSRARGD